jgi:hypothetical protein
MARDNVDDLKPFRIEDSPNDTPASGAYKSLVKFYEETISWYMHEKESKSRLSKRLRFCAISLAVLGGIAPLVNAAYGKFPSSAGYVLLALAAGLQLVDRYFGYSSSWSRYLRVAMEANGLLLMLQLRWLELTHSADQHTCETAEWAILKEYGASLAARIGEETTNWSSEFAVGIAALEARISSTPNASK